MKMLGAKEFSSLNQAALMYSVALLVFSLMFLILGVLFHSMGMVVFIDWELFFLSSVSLVYTFLLDWMSLVFLGVVSLISSMVMLYSCGYMAGDSNINRFIILVFMFVISMMLMILSPNIISILLGWDGLGITSYALVIYYQNKKASNAGMIKVLTNRLGDLALLASIAWVINFGSWDFFFIQHIYAKSELGLVLLLVVLAGMTKSAQMPFSAWLPAAMAAPTPVSALVHSSTLVTAGVYILIRFNELLGISPILAIVSVLTILMSGAAALLEFDFKKIIALSTLSQLGVMMASLSVGLYELEYFHLISHAMFKSLLFLCAGFYIHSSLDFQDIRFLGSVTNSYPLVNLYFIGCSMSLCGFPFLAGFYSKDLILASYFFSGMNWAIFFAFVLGSIFTFLYSARLLYFMFVKIFIGLVISSNGSSWCMLLPQSILFTVSIMVGSAFSWLFMPSVSVILPLTLKSLVMAAGAFSAMLLFAGVTSNSTGLSPSLEKTVSKLTLFIGSMWFLAISTSKGSIYFLLKGEKLGKKLDHGWLEEMGGQGGMGKLMKNSALVDKWSVMSYKIYLFLVFILVAYFYTML